RDVELLSSRLRGARAGAKTAPGRRAVRRHTPARIWGGAPKGSFGSSVYQQGDWLGVCSIRSVRGQTARSAGATAPARLAGPERITRGEVVTGCSGPFRVLSGRFAAIEIPSAARPVQ